MMEIPRAEIDKIFTNFPPVRLFRDKKGEIFIPDDVKFEEIRYHRLLLKLIKNPSRDLQIAVV